jgi:hypothetical protein
MYLRKLPFVSKVISRLLKSVKRFNSRNKKFALKFSSDLCYDLNQAFCRKHRDYVLASMLSPRCNDGWPALGRGDRAVEGARLEIVCTPNKGTGGSNPPLSAMNPAK